MAKPTTYATPICLVLTLIAAIGIIAGILEKNALWLIFLLLPTVIYEVYRTEGESTKWASWFLLILLVVELIFLLFNIKFNLASFLGQDYAYIGSTNVPLGDLTVVFPAAGSSVSHPILQNCRNLYKMAFCHHLHLYDCCRSYYQSQ